MPLATELDLPTLDHTDPELRGGSYRSKKSHTQCEARIALPPMASYDNGFRVVLDAQATWPDSITT